MYSVLTRDNFYSDLITEIKRAKKCIILDAFIWIKDGIGIEVAEAILEAANKDVKIFVRKDLSASIFEHTPGRIPFFAQEKVIGKKWEGIWSSETSFATQKNLYRLAYYGYGRKTRPKITRNPLLEVILNHRNIQIDHFPFCNHGKLIIIDETSYVGGQCISNDYLQWKDYNIKITNKKITRNIYHQITGKKPPYPRVETQFIQNTFQQEKSVCHILKEFIEKVGPNEELIIEMAYLGMWFYPIIKKSLKKGVKIAIITSMNADTNQNTNMWFLTKLLRLKHEHCKIFLSKDMIHTKGLATEKKVILGAANFSNAYGYFKALNEQNIISEEKALVKTIWSHFKRDIQESNHIIHHSELPKWSHFSAIKECLFIYMTSLLIFTNKKRIQKWRDHANKNLMENVSKRPSLKNTFWP